MTNKNLKDLAFEDYCAGMKYKDIAQKYDINLSTIKSWASRYWKKLQPNTKKVATKKKKSCSIQNSKKALIKPIDDLCNKVDNKNQLIETKRKAPGVCIGKLQNTNAVKHGLFSKYLPAETLELVGDIEMMSPLDILWENICLKYAAVIRSQKIMFVENADDYTKRITLEGESLAFQYTEAYEKQASFLIAQSRAMGTLMSLIKQYDELCRSSLATDEQRLRIEKLKAEITKVKETDNPAKVEIVDDVPDVEVKTGADKFE